MLQRCAPVARVPGKPSRAAGLSFCLSLNPRNMFANVHVKMIAAHALTIALCSLCQARGPDPCAAAPPAAQAGGWRQVKHHTRIFAHLVVFPKRCLERTAHTLSGRIFQAPLPREVFCNNAPPSAHVPRPRGQAPSAGHLSRKSSRKRQATVMADGWCDPTQVCAIMPACGFGERVDCHAVQPGFESQAMTMTRRVL